ncbi:MAG: 3-deoxy-7-phosphoheptulonate synthase [Chloroflexi bacterium]|nr:3-deoxy-7-phosphoheptulonate synthase [Chloroflexota bacterium]
MIIVMKKGALPEQVQAVIGRISDLGYRAHVSQGAETTIIGVIGDERRVSENVFHMMSGVDTVVRVLKPFKLASREFHPDDTIVPVNGIRLGARSVAIIAGPCAVESRDQILESAWAVKEAGGHIFRAGAFKPRTSPYSFQGMGIEGLDLLAEVRQLTGLAIITEVMAPEQVPDVAATADILQIGTRNMQNYNLLHAVGASLKPALLKRGMMSTMEELLMSAEYILSHDNPHVILCERGIRTFERYTRNTLDISAVPVLKELTHLPVMIDPSHACGKAAWVNALSRAAIAAGADGLLIEAHPHPELALSDGPQSLTPEQLYDLVADVQQVAAAVGRDLV